MWLHVEPTSRCNASCPGCARNNFGFGLTNFVLEDLDPKVLQDTIIKFKVKQVQMCGYLGDPCAAKNIDAQFDVIDNICRLQIHTNGGLRKPSWWADLAKRFDHLEQFDVWFAIDGIGDTHSYYRQGTNYNRVMENAQAFINAGGSAHWQFIPFKHNEHQIQDAIRLSQKMNFKKFQFVKNARYYSKAFHYRTGEKLDLAPWSQDKRFNRKHTIKEYVDKKNCMHLDMPSIFLSSSGIVSPCCYMRENPLKKINIAKEFNAKSFRKVCIRSCG